MGRGLTREIAFRNDERKSGENLRLENFSSLILIGFTGNSNRRFAIRTRGRKRGGRELLRASGATFMSAPPSSVACLLFYFITRVKSDGRLMLWSLRNPGRGDRAKGTPERQGQRLPVFPVKTTGTRKARKTGATKEGKKTNGSGCPEPLVSGEMPRPARSVEGASEPARS